jgi:hypothetical protein
LDRSDSKGTGLAPLAPFDQAGAWAAFAPHVTDRPFLRSEGINAPLGVPRVAAPWLVEQSREVVAAFHRYYTAIVDAKGAIGAMPARQIGEPYEQVAEAEGDRDPLPLARLDCVLAEDGRLRVIEINPVGVCTLHLRAVAYLARALERAGIDDAARAVHRLCTLRTVSMRRYVEATLAQVPARPRLAILRLPGMHRGSLVFWRRELEDAGFEVAIGTPDELVLGAAGATLRGQPIDALWEDFIVYLGFQQSRYEQTKFASKVGDYSRASELTERLLRAPALIPLLRERRLTMLSPLRAYRALSKALLAPIHREDPSLTLSAADRAFLSEHVARTYDDIDRATRTMTPERARQDREALVLKPCRFGGSHGVVLGRDLDRDAWARRLEEVWTDPEWVLQEVSEPLCDADQARLSFGLYDYGGALGGILVRSAPAMVVSARSSAIFPACL